MSDDDPTRSQLPTVTAPMTVGEPRLLMEGDRVGRFLVVRHVAQGGMGALYKAYDPQLDRAVALKLVRTGGVEETPFRERLLREARALARLSHPNVVTIYDAGVFGDNEVFIAMEFVEGTTLRRWLRTPRSIAERLDAFLEAGAGLAAAHRAGLVHRDFKPDNVIVGEDGRVRVVDFGLARATTSGGEPGEPEAARAVSPLAVDLPSPGSTPDPLATPLTQFGTQLGTPRYMAPEQHLGLPVTEKTDQFAFCVALHEALYGAPPFSAKKHDELVLAVTAGKLDPPPPGADVPRWIRDVLVRGLSRAPDARFPTLDALLDALRKDPAARRRTWIVRAWIAAAALAAAGSIAYAANRPRLACASVGRDVESAWGAERRGSVEAAFGRSGTPYAPTMLGAVERALDAYAKDWSEASVRACLAGLERSDGTREATSRCLRERLVDLGALTEQLADADAKTVASAESVALGLPSPSACTTPAGLAGTAMPPRDPVVRARVDDLERRRAGAATRADLGHLEEAQAVLEGVLHDAEVTNHGPLVADVLFDLGRVEGYRLAYAPAEARLLRAVTVADASRQDATRARAETELVRLDYTQAHYDDALTHADRAMGVAQRVGDDALTARLFMQRAWARSFAGKNEEAIEDARQGLALVTRAEGPRSPLAAELHSVLSSAASDLGRGDEAEREGREALAIVESIYAAQSERRARMSENLALVLADRHEMAEAVALQSRAVDTAVALWGDGSANTAIKRQNLGSMLVDAGRPADAIPVLQASLSALDADPEQHESQWLAYTLTGLGAAYLATGAPERARPMLERAVAIVESKDLDPDVAGESRYRLAVALVATQGDAKRASALARAGLAELEKAPKLASLADEARAWIATHAR
jgi:tetratricopeptide (TPR) repeat protein/predicted Ser/Thr protein kinase